MADWYVYQHDGDPLGPWPTDAVVEAMLAGKLAPDVLVAAPGGAKWLRAIDVPVIARLVDGIPTKPRRHESGLRLVPGELRGVDEPATTRKGLPVSSRSLHDTAEMTARPAMSFELEDEEDEEDEAPTRVALPASRSSSDPSPLPPSSTPLPPTRDAASASDPELRHRRNA